jgi:hypothetical protein
MEEERLAGSPVLVVNLRAVFHCDRVHVFLLCVLWGASILTEDRVDDRARTFTGAV